MTRAELEQEVRFVIGDKLFDALSGDGYALPRLLEMAILKRFRYMEMEYDGNERLQEAYNTLQDKGQFNFDDEKEES